MLHLQTSCPTFWTHRSTWFLQTPNSSATHQNLCRTISLELCSAYVIHHWQAKYNGPVLHMLYSREDCQHSTCFITCISTILIIWPLVEILGSPCVYLRKKTHTYRFESNLPNMSRPLIIVTHLRLFLTIFSTTTSAFSWISKVSSDKLTFCSEAPQLWRNYPSNIKQTSEMVPFSSLCPLAISWLPHPS